jgi:hypothetical protein
VLRNCRCRYIIYSSEVYIHEQLLISPHLTLDPHEADLFFVPFYSSCFMSSNFVKPGPVSSQPTVPQCSHTEPKARIQSQIILYLWNYLSSVLDICAACCAICALKCDPRLCVNTLVRVFVCMRTWLVHSRAFFHPLSKISLMQDDGG